MKRRDPALSARPGFALLLLSLCTAFLAARAEPAGSPQAGKEVFAQNCMVCHGAAGRGDGPAASGLPKRPANFAERVSTVERQRNVVTNGGPAEKLSPIMPAWGETLSEQQIRDVVAYVRTFAAAGQQASK